MLGYAKEKKGGLYQSESHKKQMTRPGGIIEDAWIRQLFTKLWVVQETLGDRGSEQQ